MLIYHDMQQSHMLHLCCCCSSCLLCTSTSSTLDSLYVLVLGNDDAENIAQYAGHALSATALSVSKISQC